MAFTSKDVMELRQRTGVGMMDCKKALVATDGDMEAAIDFLREKGMATAAKKEARIAAEGIVFAASKNGKSVLLEVNCESDFVAGGPIFKEYVAQVADYILDNTTATVADVIAAMQPVTNEYVMKMGEKLSIRRFTVYEANDTVVDTYIHMGGKIGVLVNMEVEGIDAAQVTELGKDVAMQIAAMNPAYLDKSEVDQATLDKEKEIQLAQMANDPKMAAKPEKVKQGIVMGKLGKYFEENCLLQQAFVKENKTSVEKHVAEVAKQLGGKITIKAFTRFATGEGIEKKEDDFAAEVASMIK